VPVQAAKKLRCGLLVFSELPSLLSAAAERVVSVLPWVVSSYSFLWAEYNRSQMAVSNSTFGQGAAFAITPAILGNCKWRLQLHPLFWRLASGNFNYTLYSGGLRSSLAITPAILAGCKRRLQLHPLFWRLAIGNINYTRYTGGLQSSLAVTPAILAACNRRL
jgi:hypothetical protein